MQRTAPILLALAFAAAAGCRTATPREDQEKRPYHPTYLRAERNFLEGRYDEARALFVSFRDEDPTSPHCSDALYFEGLSHLKACRTVEARRRFSDCLKAPRTLEIRADAYVGLGDSYFLEDRYAEALAAYAEALRCGTRAFREDYARYRYGLCRVRLNQWEEGQRILREVAQAFPRSPFKAECERVLSLAERRFFLQCGAFATRENAERLAEALRAEKFAARVVERPGPSGTPFVVWTGPYLDYDAARRDRPRLARAGIDAPTAIP